MKRPIDGSFAGSCPELRPPVWTSATAPVHWVAAGPRVPVAVAAVPEAEVVAVQKAPAVEAAVPEAEVVAVRKAPVAADQKAGAGPAKPRRCIAILSRQPVPN
jgi:hypothetical protein